MYRWLMVIVLSVLQAVPSSFQRVRSKSIILSWTRLHHHTGIIVLDIQQCLNNFSVELVGKRAQAA